MTKVQWATVTLDRTDASGREFQSTINMGPDGWSLDGDNLGDTRDLAEALWTAFAEDALAQSDDDDADT